MLIWDVSINFQGFQASGVSFLMTWWTWSTLQWRHNEREGVPNHCVWIVCSTVCSGAYQRKYQSSASLSLCEWNPAVTGGFPTQRASNAENVFIRWRRHVNSVYSWWHARQTMASSFSIMDIVIEDLNVKFQIKVSAHASTTLVINKLGDFSAVEQWSEHPFSVKVKHC